MTKRFSPKASDYTVRMAEVQARKAKLQRQVRELEAEEVALKAYLLAFYDVGDTVVDTGNGDLNVTYTESERTYLNQDKAIALLTRAGKKVPYFTTTVTTFKVKAAK